MLIENNLINNPEKTPFTCDVSLLGSIYAPDLFGDYDTPESIPEWSWIEQHASFTHIENNNSGVWEFMVNVDRYFDESQSKFIDKDGDNFPDKLLPIFEDAKSKNISYIIFYQ